jgi:hypothetical protein
MAEYSDRLRDLWYLREETLDNEKELRALMSRHLTPALFEKERKKLEEASRSLQRQIQEQLDDLARFPRHHDRHFRFLEKLHEATPYEKSLFVMTKFPETDPARRTPADAQLEAVLAAVAEQATRAGYVARLASDKDFHQQLWDNVELFLLGCCRGVAVVEDKVRPELNPNVAMEWGWMRAMGKPVLFLVEKDFAHLRADWSGLLRYDFAWSDPAPGVEAALRRFLSI